MSIAQLCAKPPVFNHFLATTTHQILSMNCLQARNRLGHSSCNDLHLTCFAKPHVSTIIPANKCNPLPVARIAFSLSLWLSTPTTPYSSGNKRSPVFPRTEPRKSRVAILGSNVYRNSNVQCGEFSLWGTKNRLPSSNHFSVISLASSSSMEAHSSASAEDSKKTMQKADPLVQYIVLRKDLVDTMKWPLGSVISQGCHAAVAAIWLHKDDSVTAEYCGSGNLDHMHKVTLEVKGETQLRNLAQKLETGGVAHKLWMRCLIPQEQAKVHRSLTPF